MKSALEMLYEEYDWVAACGCYVKTSSAGIVRNFCLTHAFD